MSIAYSTEFIEKASDILAMKIVMDEAWEVFAKRTEATEDKFKPKMQATFTKQEKAIIAKMKRTPIPELDKAMSDEAIEAAEVYAGRVYNPDDWHATFRATAKPFVTEAMAEAGGAALNEVGVDVSFNVTNERAKKVINDRVFKFAKEVNETTQDKLRLTFAQGFDAGDGIRELSQRVADVFDIAKGSRTNTIARTEIVGAANEGTYEGYIQSEIVETNIWVATRDAKTRDSHKDVDGEEVKLTETFSNGLRYPHDSRGSADEVINCRCTHIAGKFTEAT